jgi:hypothetical protein
MEENRNACRIFVGNPEGRRPLGRPRHSLVDISTMDLGERKWGGRDWIDLAQDRDQWRTVVNTIINLRVPYNAGKFLSGCTIGGVSRSAQLRE